MQSPSAVPSGMLPSTQHAIAVAAAAAAVVAVVVHVIDGEPTVVAVITVALGLLVALAGTWWARASRKILQEQQMLVVVHGIVHELAEAQTSNEAARRAVRHVAQSLGATAGEAVFFTPPNKTVNLGRLRGGRTWSPEEVRGDLREMLTGWIQTDPVARRLGPDDTHPLRPWLRAEGLADAIVVPLLDPEPHGVLVVGNRPNGTFSESQLELARRLGREVTGGILRARRHESLRGLQPLQQVHSEVSVDVVTGLPDEDVLAGHLRQVAAQDHQDVVVAAFALDDLEAIRNQAGDRVVDAVCRQVGARLLSTIRRTDLVAVDEDRFVVVMHGVGRVEHAMRACERLLTQVERPVMFGNRILRTTASCGVSAWAGTERGRATVEEVLAQATAALGRASADPHHAVHLYSEQAVDHPRSGNGAVQRPERIEAARR